MLRRIYIFINYIAHNIIDKTFIHIHEIPVLPYCCWMTQAGKFIARKVIYIGFIFNKLFNCRAQYGF